MRRHFDYLVVGSGLAGLYAAYCAAKHGKVGLLTKSALTESNSYFAQGGIAAVTDKDDIPQYHFEDTIIAGRGLCDAPAVRILVNEGPQRIQEIIRAGMQFDIAESGELALGLEGGHHRRRILHAGGDATGRLVTQFVLNQVCANADIAMFPNCTLVDLLVSEGHCDGVRCWNFETQQEDLFLAGQTILACGGSAAIYQRTTNPQSTTGDGVAIAWRAGCEIEDMEFIQFHPTAIVHPQGDSFLVSEAVRGEGAHLINLHGERFMVGAHELAELAPRDVVAQHIDRQIRQEGKGYVYLSLQHLDPQKIRSRFPTIDAKCRELGIEMTDRIPIAPAAHYTVGGVRTDEFSQTNIRHLYVCGELASTGIMGANRLASNSLIECLVFGKRAIEHTLAGNPGERTAAAGQYGERLYADPAGEALYKRVRERVAAILSEHAGLVRSGEQLQAALDELEELRRTQLPEQSGDRQNVYEAMSDNLCRTASLILTGALTRRESRGCHCRKDYPKEMQEFRVHLIQQKGQPIREVPVKR